MHTACRERKAIVSFRVQVFLVFSTPNLFSLGNWVGKFCLNLNTRWVRSAEKKCHFKILILFKHWRKLIEVFDFACSSLRNVVINISLKTHCPTLLQP